MSGKSTRDPRRARAAVIVVAALVLTACASPGASPALPSPDAPTAVPATPVPSPVPAPTPTAVPGAVAWTWQAPSGSPIALGPDGTIYATGPAPACAVAVHAHAPDGSERTDGWPYCAAGARYLGLLAVDDGGTVYVGDANGIVGLAPDGTPGPAWKAPFASLVGTLEAGLVVMVPHEGGSSELLGYGADGRALPGWPVTVPGTIVEGSALVGPDDTVAVLYRDTASGHRSVTRLARDGSTSPGWPVAVPGEMDGASVVIDLVASDGRVVLRSHEPWPAGDSVDAMVGLRAQVAVIRPDGTIPEGWPVRFEQPLSPLVEGSDGRLVAVAGDVQYGPEPGSREPVGPYLVVSLEPDGGASSGWPARLPDGFSPEPAEEVPGPVEPWALPPVVGPDGSAVVLVRGEGTEGLAWFEADGSLATSFELPATLALSHGMPAAPGGPAKLPLVVGDRALLFVGVKRPAASAGDGLPPVDAPPIAAPILATLADTSGGSQDGVLALERTGPVAGWPVLLPPRTYAGEAVLAPDGLLIVVGTTEGEAEPLPGVIAAVDPAATGAPR